MSRIFWSFAMSFRMACSVTLSRAAIFGTCTCLFFSPAKSVDTGIPSVDYTSIGE
jgi:hypothetical protein